MWRATRLASCGRTWPPMMRTPALYTQSLGAWHGFIAQQQMIAVKKHFGTTKRRYIYLSGWMVAALRVGVRPAAGPVDAREDQRPQADRGNLHLPAPGRRARTRRPVPRDRRRPRKGDARPRGRADGEGRDLRDPRRAHHRRHRRRVRQRGSDLPAGQEDDRGRRLRAADRKPGVRREAVRPPGRQGHRPARGLHRQGARHAAMPSWSWAWKTASSSPAPTRSAPG